MGEMFHTEQFDFTEVSNGSSESKSAQQVENKNSSEKVNFFGVEGRVPSEIELFGSGIGFFHAQDNTDELGLAMSQHQIYQQQHLKEFGNFDDLYLDVVSPPFQSCEDEIRKIIGSEEIQKQEPKLDGKISSTEIQATDATGPMVSTEIIIKLAAEKFIQSMSRSSNELSMLNHPYPSSILAHSEEDSEEVQLVQNLLSCAEKVAEKQYERAIKFLKECDKMSSRTGTPIQSLVFYFSEALSEKIARETGRITPKDLEKKAVDPLERVKFPSTTLIAFHKEYPVSQITKLVAIQAIVDHLEEARKLHVIDLEIGSGVQWIILMQALAAQSEHPIQHLKITAMGTKSKLILEDTGRQLASFAQSLHLTFTFKIILVEDILDLNQDLFELDADEALAVYESFSLMRMIGRVDRLDLLMRVIRNISPCVMVVSEVEANCNSPTFVGRFIESLFFFGVFFDSLADCLKNDETSRRDTESTWFRSTIRNVLAAKGDERKIRHVNINVWRAYFARFGLVEIELSMSSLDQANLVLQSFSYGNSFTLYRDGKSFTIGWKGTPLSSVSAWKFQ
ncbi:hypothetical protein Pfo_025958 [Paulownia fortunei]|nr:hypothetical protein Pfo_025958 [Paulownia fortunei]